MNEYTSVGGVAYTYDADGNLTLRRTNTYTYNSLNQLIGVTGPSGTTTYTYNALGNRSSTTEWRGHQVSDRLRRDWPTRGRVRRQRATSSRTTPTGWALTSQVTGGGTYYYDFDALGSTVGLTSGDGNYVNSYSYLPFGQSFTLSHSISNPFQFIGAAGVTTEASDLQSMGARYEDPHDGRFTVADPPEFWVE